MYDKIDVRYIETHTQRSATLHQAFDHMKSMPVDGLAPLHMEHADIGRAAFVLEGEGGPGQTTLDEFDYIPGRRSLPSVRPSPNRWRVLFRSSCTVFAV